MTSSIILQHIFLLSNSSTTRLIRMFGGRKCIGPQSYECLQCEEGRALVREPGQSHGQCHVCSESCTSGKCVGPNDNDCLECTEDRVLVVPPNKTAGSCVLCAQSCAPLHCIDSGSDKCTRCPRDRVLILNANATKVAGQQLATAQEEATTANTTKLAADLKLTEVNKTLYEAKQAWEEEGSEAAELQLQDAKIAFKEAKHEVNMCNVQPS